MKRTGISLFFMLACGLLTTAQGKILYDNSNITTDVGVGANGANISTIATNGTAYGYTSNSDTLTYELADDFSLAGTSTVSMITFDAYSTSTYPNPPVSPFTGGKVSIWSAQPGTAGATVLFTSSTLAATQWTGVYRVTSTTATNAQRPVFSLSMSFANVPLAAGSYWASFDVTSLTTPGNSASIYTPPVMSTDGSMPAGNAIQSADGGATWAAVADATTGERVPLIISGTQVVVPEPGTVTLGVLAGMGILAAVRRRANV